MSESVGQKMSVIQVAAAGKASRIVRYGNYWENHVALLSQLFSFLTLYGINKSVTAKVFGSLFVQNRKYMNSLSLF